MSTQADRGWMARILGVAAGDLPLEGTIGSFDGATVWLNSAPLTPASLRGHVVVVQFWTYTCINWLRTQAYFRAWGQRYRDHGLITIGVHTPEFKFEHDLDNVRWAVEARKIDYPVAIDNDVAVPRQWRRSLLLHVWLIDSESARKPMTSAVTGDWTVRSDASALNGTNGRVAYQFHARDVNPTCCASPMIATQRRISVRLRDWPNHCPRLATVRCLEEVDGIAGRVRPQSKTSVLVDKVQSAEYTFRGLQQKVSVNVHPCCSGVMSPIDRDGRGR